MRITFEEANLVRRALACFVAAPSLWGRGLYYDADTGKLCLGGAMQALATGERPGFNARGLAATGTITGLNDRAKSVPDLIVRCVEMFGERVRPTDKDVHRALHGDAK